MNDTPYKTILVIVTGFIVLSVFVDGDWPVYVAIGVGLLALISTFFTHWILRLWFGIAQVLGYINSRILLSVVYFLILVPLAFLSRLSKKNALYLKREGLATFYHERNHLFQRADLEKPW